MEDKKVLAKRNYYDHKDSGSAFLWAVLAPYIISFMAVFVAMMIGKSMGKNLEEIVSSLGFIITSAVLTPLVFVAVFFIYNSAKNISFSACKLKFSLNVKTILILIAISFICVFGLQYLISGIDIGLESIGYKLASTNIPLSNGWWYVLNLVILGILPAIGEELIFRGIIFNGLRRNFKDFFAVVISALLFTLMHASLEQFVYPFLMGLLFGLLVLRTKTILSSMIVHCANNMIVVTIAFIYEMTGFDFMPKQTWLFVALIFVLLLASVSLLYLIDRFYFRKQQRKEKEDEKTEKQEGYKGFPSISLAIGFALAIVFFVINIITSFMN